MPNRHASTSEYRYGFQGQEKDDEIKGEGNSLNYTFRMHDPRVGRFFAVDPLSAKYPFYSPYIFSGNRVIDSRELEGKEPEKVGKNNPYLVIIVQGRAGGMFGDETEKGKTQYKNLPNGYNNSDDGLTLVKVFPLKLKPTIVIFSGSDDDMTALDIQQTIKNYRKTNPNGKIALVGHSLGGKDVMKAALLVENDETIKNKTIDLLITLEAANTDNRGTSQTDVLGTNVKSIINYSSSESSMKGGGGIPTAGSDQQVRNIELPKGTTHKNMDNTLLPAINTILTRLGIGQDPINISDRIDYSKLKIYENGDRKKGAEGGTSR